MEEVLAGNDKLEAYPTPDDKLEAYPTPDDKLEAYPTLDDKLEAYPTPDDKLEALGLPTFFPSDGLSAVEHCMECHPSTPQHKPPRTFVTSAVLVSAEAG